MKNSAGTVPPVFVLMDEGKNGACGPAPSCSIDSGGVLGLRIVNASRNRASRVMTAGITARPVSSATATAVQNAGRKWRTGGPAARCRAAAATTVTIATTDNATCAYSKGRYGRVAPNQSTASPSPPARTQNTSARPDSDRSGGRRDQAQTAPASTTATPSTAWMPTCA